MMVHGIHFLIIHGAQSSVTVQGAKQGIWVVAMDLCPKLVLSIFGAQSLLAAYASAFLVRSP